MSDRHGREKTPTTALPEAAGAPRTLSSAALFGADHEICILHENQTYRLRITRQGKLILTK